MAATHRHVYACTSMVMAWLLAGCATPTLDDNFRPVAELGHSRLQGQDVRWLQSDAERQQLRQMIDDKLKQPLSSDDAVQIALLNNRGLQARYAQLGIAVGELRTLTGIPDIGFSLARLHQGNGIELDQRASVDLLGLLTRPWAQRIEQRNLQQVRLDVMAEMLKLAHDTRQAWLEAVAAQEQVTLAEHSNHAAQTARDVVERLMQVGNLSRLDLLRAQALYADSQAELASAQQQALLQQSRLTALLGLWGADSNYRLPATLAPLPTTVRSDQAIETLALQQRLDILAANSASERLALSLGMTRTNRFIDVLDLGYQHNRVSGQPAQQGYDIAVRVPLFTGGARQQQAQLRYQQSLDLAADTAIRARAEVRASYSLYRLAYDTAAHYQNQVLPVHAQIAAEVLLRYNGMLLSVLDVIANARDQAQIQRAALEAKRNFWLADNTLDAAMNGVTTTTARP